MRTKLIRDETDTVISTAGRNLLGRCYGQLQVEDFSSSLVEVAMKTAPEALAGLAEVHTKSGALEQALELLTLVLNHPSTAQETEDRIADLHAELLAELPLALH